MPLRLEIKKKLTARSERVKCVDFHPTEPWILAGLYTGHIFIWNYMTQSVLKSIEVCDLPVRAAKFIAAKNWIVCGADDMQIRVYNYNTMERIRTFEAHTDYIRAIAIHPSLPCILSSSDDMFIKLWDWEKNWECVQIFEGHTHYVMQIEFNPKDPNTFASASLDRTVKIWGLTSGNPHFALEGHERGVNCISYFRGGDRPYLLSGADDQTVKVWDYQTKTCVATLEGHTNNVSSVMFHPTLPIILSGSEDGTVRIWHSNNYKLENTLNYGMERVWTIACLKNSNKVAIGYDDGTIMIKIGQEEPVVSMEKGGKVVWAKNHDIVTANVRAVALDGVADGDRLNVSAKELGACELYPQSLSHDPKGRLLCACGDGEYIIYTALTLKNKSFGSALEFVWAAESGVYATRESPSKVKLFKNFEEHKSFRPSFAAEGIFGGTLLGIRSNEFIDFYDWSEMRTVRRIDVCPKKVFWSETGDMVILACDASMYVLRYNRELVQKFFDQGIEIPEQGIEGAFELEQEVPEKVRAGYCIGDCLVYVNSANRLQYYVGGEVMTLAHLGKPMSLLGYLPKENRVYLIDKAHNVYSYSLLLSVLVYQTAIVRRDFDAARKTLASIPADHYNRLARFLEAQDLKEMALEVANDPEHKFELAMQCKKLQLAKEIALQNESEQKWRQLGDAALNQEFDLKLAEDCYWRANDLGGLLLMYTSLGDAAGMEKLADTAKSLGRNNVAFLCYFLLHRLDSCVQLLCETDRIPEAAFFTRTFLPSQISKILKLWKENLAKVSLTAAEALADPLEFADKFPDLQVGLTVEQWIQENEKRLPPADSYPVFTENILRNLINEMKEGVLQSPVDLTKIDPSEHLPLNLPSAAVSAPVPSFSAPVIAAAAALSQQNGTGSKSGKEEKTAAPISSPRKPAVISSPPAPTAAAVSQPLQPAAQHNAPPPPATAAAASSVAAAALKAAISSAPRQDEDDEEVDEEEEERKIQAAKVQAQAQADAKKAAAAAAATRPLPVLPVTSHSSSVAAGRPAPASVTSSAASDLDIDVQVPSLEDINSSLAALDDDFDSFE